MEAAAAVEAWFAEEPDLTMERIETRSGRPGWFTVLRGEHKRTVPVYLELGEENLSVQSFFLAAPDENQAEVYGYLLRRNARTYLLRFALTDTGEVLLVGQVPRTAVDVALLDRLLGQVLATADETFDPALRLGFASYIAHEQAWRARVGAPPNPVG